MSSPIRSRVADTVRAELARQRISATRLAEHLGKSQPAISRRLTGEVAFDVDELQQVADLLEVPIADLLGAEVPA